MLIRRLDVAGLPKWSKLLVKVGDGKSGTGGTYCCFPSREEKLLPTTVILGTKGDSLKCVISFAISENRADQAVPFPPARQLTM